MRALVLLTLPSTTIASCTDEIKGAIAYCWTLHVLSIFHTYSSIPKRGEGRGEGDKR